MKSLLELYGEHQGKVSDKWSTYLAEYERLFSGFRDQPVRMLEIGVQNGGSLEIWSKYFPNAQILVGCDINPDCAKLAYDDPRIQLVIGDANTDTVENEIVSHSPIFDLVIDDGSHNSSDIAKSFALYFRHLNEGGIFVAEDLHCSYWRECEGGLYYPYSSMAFFKRLADVVNHEHWGIAKERRQLLRGFSEKFSVEFDEGDLAGIHSIEFFNSVCVVRKLQAGSNVLGERFIAGQQAFVVAETYRLSGTSQAPSQASNAWAAMIRAPEEAWQQLAGELLDRDSQIACLNQAVAERDGQIASLSRDLKMMIASRSWQITRPLRWAVLQVRLLREHGLSSRFHAFARKGVRGVSSRGLHYVRARPELRARAHGWALKLGLRDQLQALYGKVQTQAAGGVPNLRNLVASSYQAWCEHFDTPSMEIMDRFARTSESKPRVIIVARFEKASESYAAVLAQRLVDSVGQDWHAVFLFSSDCEAAETIRKISVVANDPRIVFDAAVVTRDAEIAILIEGGALPRPHALRILADTLRSSPEALLAYSDEDILFEGDLPRDPWFKPEFSPLLASQGLLLGRMVAFKVAGAESAGVLEKLLSTSIDTAGFVRDYAITLGKRCVLHVPHVLFHDAFARRAPIVHEWSLPEVLPKATIIIPTKDRWDLLGPCLDSLWLSDWPTELLDIVVVDNGSTDSKTLTMLRKLESEGRIRVIRHAGQFNWSRLNNLAVQESDGELLVFLNNDTEVDDRAWLKKMATQALRFGVGAVGCKLLYPDRTVQHGGVIAGIQGVAGHAHLFLQASEGGYCNLANITREVSAVTGACLAVTRKNFLLAGGFDENFRVAFNDVMFCFALQSLGLWNIYVADPLLIHHESKSRGYDDTPEKKSLNREETAKAWAKHPSVMRNDPFYSPNLSLFKPYDLSFAPRRRAAWDDQKARPLRVMMLSVTHAIGHGVPVVLSLQAEALVKRGYEVIVAGPRSANDFPYPGCKRLEVHDPIDAAVFAADLSVDVVIVHTMPFFNITKWTGGYPAVICYDHGEPPSDWFPDATLRKAALLEKDLALTMATAVYAISDAIAAESMVPVAGVIPEGNTHLGQWNEEAKERRNRVRLERGWTDHFVVLNVCRFHVGERVYKGIDTFVSVFDACKSLNHEQSDSLIFVLCGKGTPDDVAEMTRCGLLVQANVSNDEMLDLYCAADAYANFSKWEGYNLGIAQALAMGLPTIASDIPAHRAFSINVSNDVGDAVEWVLQAAINNEARVPRIWAWDKPLEQLIDVVESVSRGVRAVPNL
jgi:GT2 family glycosyltransferase